MPRRAVTRTRGCEPSEMRAPTERTSIRRRSPTRSIRALPNEASEIGWLLRHRVDVTAMPGREQRADGLAPTQTMQPHGGREARIIGVRNR